MSESSQSSKTIMLCGATGLIGRALCRQLIKQGNKLVLVGRQVEKMKRCFDFPATLLAWQQLSNYDPAGIDTIVNLAGARVANLRWSRSYKNILTTSRLEATRQCVALCKKNPDIHLINASAVSIYGLYSEDHPAFDENQSKSASHTGFLADLSYQWERTAMQAEQYASRLTLLRTAVVLDKSDGALPVMALPYRLFAGGAAGHGRQVLSWISLVDVVNAIGFLIQHKGLNGAVNLVSPGACQQNQFAQALGRALSRPSFWRTPDFAIKTLLGQMGTELVLMGQRVVPRRLEQQGFTFQDIKIDDFLYSHFNAS